MMTMTTSRREDIIAALRSVTGEVDWADTSDEGALDLRVEYEDGNGCSVVWRVYDMGFGATLTLEYGCLTFECDVTPEGYVDTARRLLAAVDAWAKLPVGGDNAP
jgi:hypothetical protein